MYWHQPRYSLHDVLAPTQIFFAYLLSDVYLVDQVNYSITVRDHTTTEAFVSNVTLSVGATMVIYDSNGNERTSGDLADGDVVTVTAGDGETAVSYAVSITETGFENLQNAEIQMFPNPSNGILNVTGLQPGQTIKVLNSVGMVIETIDVRTSHEVLSLDDQPAGIYLIIVGDKDQLIGRYKAIKY
jgi:hypothetical protein